MFKEKKNVMLAVDNPYRELRGIYSVKMRLAELGISSFIAPIDHIFFYYNLFTPEIVVLPNVCGNSLKIFVEQAQRKSKICFLPSEHCFGKPDRVIALFTGKGVDMNMPSAIEGVDMAFMPGHKHYEVIRDANVLPENKMLTTGTLNSDQRFFQYAPKRTKGLEIGIATCHKTVMYGVPEASLSIINCMDIYRRESGEGWQEWTWRIDAMALDSVDVLIITEIVEKLSDKGLKINIRPHPHENIKIWEPYINNCKKNVRLNRDVRLDEWLDKIFVSICTFSTTGLDSIARGVPAISVQKMIPHRYLDNMPFARKPFGALPEMQFLWFPENIDELCDMVDKASRNELPLSPKIEETRRFMAERFNFPRKNLACIMIGDKIAEIYNSMLAYRKMEKGTAPLSQSVNYSEHNSGVITRFRRLLKVAIMLLPYGRTLLGIIFSFYVFLYDKRREKTYSCLQVSHQLNAKKYYDRLIYFWRNYSGDAKSNH